MARRKIREFDAKNLLAQYCQKHAPELQISPQMVPITSETNLQTLPTEHPWLLQNPLVAKPDQLFGKRGKLNLVLLNATWDETRKYLKENLNQTITIGKATDKLTYFLIEPYIAHSKEYYLAFSSQRNEDFIYFSVKGGIDIEENWNEVVTIPVPTLTKIENINLAPRIPPVLHPFITAAFNAFRDLNFTRLEFNPCTITDQIHLLDTVAQVDDCSKEWSNFEFPLPFGRKVSPQERLIHKLDADSGASLKLTVLNPKGRIWNILSGGGASIIFLDTIADLGKQEEIANYGEYSGNPTTEESYHYAKTILQLMTKEPCPEGKILIIGGAIANFTDVEKTFTGIILALKEHQEQFRTGNIQIFVRRGGPNYEKGLKLMEQAGKELGIPLTIAGPDTPMIKIIGKALGTLQ